MYQQIIYCISSTGLKFETTIENYLHTYVMPTTTSPIGTAPVLCAVEKEGKYYTARSSQFKHMEPFEYFDSMEAADQSVLDWLYEYWTTHGNNEWPEVFDSPLDWDNN